MKRLGIAAAFLAVGSMLLFAQDSITVDLSHMVESQVAYLAQPITNALMLSQCTNGVARTPRYADGVNDALDAVKRVTAKLPNGTNLTLEAVCGLVCEELHIERRK